MEPNKAYTTLQKQLNKLARNILNVRKSDCVSERDLMISTGVRNINSVVIPQLFKYATMIVHNNHPNNYIMKCNHENTRAGKNKNWRSFGSNNTTQNSFISRMIKLWNEHCQNIISESVDETKANIKHISRNIPYSVYQ